MPADRRASATSSASLRQPARLNVEKALEAIFGEFQTLGDRVLIEALAEAKQFCRDMASADKPARWISLLGVSGTGKTMLAKMIARFFRRHLDCLPDERNKDGEAWCRRGGLKEWGNIVGDLLDGDYSGIKDLRQDWFLALDDIGVEYKGVRELATSKLYEVLNARLGLWTVITANLSLEDISERLDTRIASRLLRDKSSIVTFETEDFNLREAA